MRVRNSLLLMLLRAVRSMSDASIDLFAHALPFSFWFSLLLPGAHDSGRSRGPNIRCGMIKAVDWGFLYSKTIGRSIESMRSSQAAAPQASAQQLWLAGRNTTTAVVGRPLLLAGLNTTTVVLALRTLFTLLLARPQLVGSFAALKPSATHVTRIATTRMCHTSGNSVHGGNNSSVSHNLCIILLFAVLGPKGGFRVMVPLVRTLWMVPEVYLVLFQVPTPTNVHRKKICVSRNSV